MPLKSILKSAPFSLNNNHTASNPLRNLVSATTPKNIRILAPAEVLAKSFSAVKNVAWFTLPTTVRSPAFCDLLSSMAKRICYRHSRRDIYKHNRIFLKPKVKSRAKYAREWRLELPQHTMLQYQLLRRWRDQIHLVLSRSQFRVTYSSSRQIQLA